VCPRNQKFSQELAEDSPFRAREFIAGKDAVTLATDILPLDQETISAAFRKSPMKRAKRRGLQRNASNVMGNVAPMSAVLARDTGVHDGDAHTRETEESTRSD